MSVLIYLIPLALLLGLIWLAVFIWTLRTHQYDDLAGAARRILADTDTPLPPAQARTQKLRRGFRY